MKIRLVVGDVVFPATLEDNAPARDLAALFPLKVDLGDYGEIEKVCDLPRALDTTGSPAGTSAKVGHLTLYAPWGNLAIFLRDFGYARGLVHLGRFDSNMERLRRLATPATGRFEIAPDA